MALLVQTWDIPAGRGGREEYALIGQEAISTVLAQPGVLEFRAYRNPLRASPQVMVQIEFESDAALQRFLDSFSYGDIIGDLSRVGCLNIQSQVWTGSPVVPTPRRPGAH
jgi:quinol monooxygenase YgiN